MYSAQTLPDSVLRQLIAVAKRAAAQAYCPYSRFPVSAAVLSAEGDIHTGCNVENTCPGLSLCALPLRPSRRPCRPLRALPGRGLRHLSAASVATAPIAARMPRPAPRPGCVSRPPP
ncbi:hypothetical protein F2Q65_18070 [Thiohalocapsa marina]|uniref:CMP/dCMP-type deaminase domain-containing protein n=1 Tax=Thiohalocapsa marina TaxID=424902 RepID=A0A5M8FBP2_9GAMM|nr:hypothetical protein F2Q65_18070 [Thiohalocapsa marina]